MWTRKRQTFSVLLFSTIVCFFTFGIVVNLPQSLSDPNAMIAQYQDHGYYDFPRLSGDKPIEKVTPSITFNVRKGDNSNYTQMGNGDRYPNFIYQANFTLKHSQTDIDFVLRKITELNRDQYIYNEEIFGSVQNNTIMIVIQVHNRLNYLRQLIMSLSKAKHIERTLLIFSHDYWDTDINNLVASIDFAKCMQIFYPYSIQTHMYEFPGEVKGDCPRNTNIKQAKRLGCKNANWPDVYGHYREAKFSQTKHHWWWKANRIFDQLRVTQDHHGLVLFLEEDHHVSEDFLHMLRKMDTLREDTESNSEIICLGSYLKKNFMKNNKPVSSKQFSHSGIS